MCMDTSIPGNIISVPRGFLNCTPIIGPRTLLEFGAIVEALQSVTSLPSVSDVVDAGIFLQVGTTRDRIVLANSDSPHSVRCMILDVCSYDEEEVRLTRAGRFVDIDFETLTHSEMRLQVFTRMVLWTCTKSTTSVAPKRFCLGDAVASNAARGTALPLTDGSQVAVLMAAMSATSCRRQLDPVRDDHSRP